MRKKLYYLSHPYTSVGEKYLNIISSRMIAHYLAINKNIITINPLDIIPRVTNEEGKALEICKNLLVHCDFLILSGDWKHSKGCQLELTWAIELGIPVFLYTDSGLKRYE